MNARKLLVAGAALSVAWPVQAGPTVDTCRVTGNVVAGQGKGPGQACRLDEQLVVAVDGVKVQLTGPTTCSIEGTPVHQGEQCRIELLDGRVEKLPVAPEAPPPAEVPPPPPPVEPGT